MGKQLRFINFISRYSLGKPFTEATATTALSRWLYKGHGEKHLSLPVSDDGIGRPANARPRRFRCPSQRQDYARWQPFREHLFGDQKGLVSDATTTLLPFIAVDIDRHSGAIEAADHQQIVIEAGRYLCRSFPHIKWLVEVNPKNGSTKFFGFRRTGNHFTKSESQELASKLRREFGKIGRRWHCADFAFKRRILELLFDGFVLEGDWLVPTYRTPVELFRAG